MNVDKRLEEKLETILTYDKENSEKMTQSTMTHTEHQQLILEILEEDVPELISQLKAEQEEKERYKKALEFYADEQTHKLKYTPGDWIPTTPINIDNGKTARQALEGSS